MPKIDWDKVETVTETPSICVELNERAYMDESEWKWAVSNGWHPEALEALVPVDDQSAFVAWLKSHDDVNDMRHQQPAPEPHGSYLWLTYAGTVVSYQITNDGSDYSIDLITEVFMAMKANTERGAAKAAAVEMYNQGGSNDPDNPAYFQVPAKWIPFDLPSKDYLFDYLLSDREFVSRAYGELLYERSLTPSIYELTPSDRPKFISWLRACSTEDHSYHLDVDGYTATIAYDGTVLYPDPDELDTLPAKEELFTKFSQGAGIFEKPLAEAYKDWLKEWPALERKRHTPPERRLLATSLAIKKMPSLAPGETYEEQLKAVDPENVITERIIADLPKGVETGIPITDNGVSILNSITSFAKAGCWHFPAASLYKFNKGTKTTPSAQSLNDMLAEIKRCMVTPVTVYLAEENRESGEAVNGGYSKKVETTALKAYIETGKATNGRTTVMVYVQEVPVIWQLALNRKQTTSIPQAAFERVMESVRATPETVRLVEYLVQTAAEIKRARNISNQRRYETLYRVYNPDKTWDDISRVLQKNFRDLVRTIMDGLQAEHRFNDWYEYKNEGGTKGGLCLTTTKVEKPSKNDKDKTERITCKTERKKEYARTKADGITIWPRPRENRKRLKSASSN